MPMTLPGRRVEMLYLDIMVDEEPYEPFTTYGPHIYRWIVEGHLEYFMDKRRDERLLDEVVRQGYIERHTEDHTLSLTRKGWEYARGNLIRAGLIH